MRIDLSKSFRFTLLNEFQPNTLEAMILSLDAALITVAE